MDILQNITQVSRMSAGNFELTAKHHPSICRNWAGGFIKSYNLIMSHVSCVCK